MPPLAGLLEDLLGGDHDLPRLGAEPLGLGEHRAGLGGGAGGVPGACEQCAGRGLQRLEGAGGQREVHDPVLRGRPAQDAGEPLGRLRVGDPGGGQLGAGLGGRALGLAERARGGLELLGRPGRDGAGELLALGGLAQRRGGRRLGGGGGLALTVGGITGGRRVGQLGGGPARGGAAGARADSARVAARDAARSRGARAFTAAQARSSAAASVRQAPSAASRRSAAARCSAACAQSLAGRSTTPCAGR
ncbi:MAG: hypothetical protein U0237_09465 [Thermoleophilia bacterium]